VEDSSASTRQDLPSALRIHGIGHEVVCANQGGKRRSVRTDRPTDAKSIAALHERIRAPFRIRAARREGRHVLVRRGTVLWPYQEGNCMSGIRLQKNFACAHGRVFRRELSAVRPRRRDPLPPLGRNDPSSGPHESRGSGQDVLEVTPGVCRFPALD
jgi:hypothetical protein